MDGKNKQLAAAKFRLAANARRPDANLRLADVSESEDGTLTMTMVDDSKITAGEQPYSEYEQRRKPSWDFESAESMQRFAEWFNSSELTLGPDGSTHTYKALAQILNVSAPTAKKYATGDAQLSVWAAEHLYRAIGEASYLGIVFGAEEGAQLEGKTSLKTQALDLAEECRSLLRFLEGAGEDQIARIEALEDARRALQLVKDAHFPSAESGEDPA